jgi:DNA-binding FrmR family transcriptional regulator
MPDTTPVPASAPAPAVPAPSPAIENAALIARLHRIEGQVRGIARMLEEARACEDVVTQLMAVRSSIDTAGAAVLDAYLATCLLERDPESQVAALRDAMRLWWKFAPAAGGTGALPTEVGAASPLPR